MKIAIHHKINSFSEYWIDYCIRNGISFKLVDAYKNDIIHQVSDCDIFMFPIFHFDYRDMLYAKQLLLCIEKMGKVVFPDFNSAWHFDDKVGQKYLLESINAPLVPSYVFYTQKEALSWINTTLFPKVFKLRSGAGSSNVKLVANKRKAKILIYKAFKRGFPQFDRIGYLKEKIRQFNEKQETFWGIIKGIVRLFVQTKFSKMYSKEKGYIYFQNFIPYNNYDIRIIVIGEKAIAIKRMVRKNDFRASGSGHVIYLKEFIDINCIRISFDISEKLNCLCMSYDFVFENNKPFLVEMSYGFVKKIYDHCDGYWTKDLIWHNEKVVSMVWIMEELINKFYRK